MKLFKVFEDYFFLISILKKRKFFFGIIFLIVVCTILESLSILLLAPLASLLSESSSENIIISYIEKIFFFNGLDIFTNFLYLFLLIFLIKSIFLTFLSFYQTKFAADMQRDLSNKILLNFSSRPLTFHNRNNSSNLLRAAINDTNLLTNSGILNFITLISEMFIFLGIILVLFYYNPLVSFFVGILILSAAFIMIFSSKNILLKVGALRVLNDGKRIQATQEILGGIRTIKLTQNLDIFLNKFKDPNYIFAKSGRIQAFLQLLPRIWFELILVSTLVLIALFVISNGGESSQIIPIFALYAGAGFRVLPSISRIVASNQSVRFTTQVTEDISTIFKTDIASSKKLFKNENLFFNKKIEFKNVSYSYPNSKNNVLEEISFSFSKGNFIGISGSSGSGKTTFLDLLAGLIEPSQGKIFSDTTEIDKNFIEWQSKIAYVEQSTFLIDASLAENIAFGIARKKIDFDKIYQICSKIGLKDFVDNLPNGLNHFVGERGVSLSGGQLQRIGIARALYKDSEILILDEITSSLDKKNENSILKLINQLKGSKTIFLISHNISEVSKFDYIIEFKDKNFYRI